ncbi:PilZ domain-containing protein [Clostridium sp. ATCC 25772]|uniref:PilZ domain-containing protein n=1 Tax=Clostridium sp. ATCC 25772 TaxID=1676991 RepID=UPI000785E768|nr:PilZ domain-containing protein [Clostridium sp. ATCC 25772]
MQYNYSLIKAESLYGDLTATGIIQYFDNNKLIMSINNEHMSNCKENFFLSIFSKKEGVLVYEASISKIYAKNIEFTNIRFLYSKNRRLHSRVNINITLPVNILKKSHKEVINLSKPILMIAKNISISGILLESPLNLPLDLNFILLLPIGTTTITIITETKRKFKTDCMYNYGCKFKFINKADEQLLRKFILDNKLDQLKYRNVTTK